MALVNNIKKPGSNDVLIHIGKTFDSNWISIGRSNNQWFVNKHELQLNKWQEILLSNLNITVWISPTDQDLIKMNQLEYVSLTYPENPKKLTRAKCDQILQGLQQALLAT